MYTKIANRTCQGVTTELILVPALTIYGAWQENKTKQKDIQHILFYFWFYICLLYNVNLVFFLLFIGFVCPRSNMASSEGCPRKTPSFLVPWVKTRISPAGYPVNIIQISSTQMCDYFLTRQSSARYPPDIPRTEYRV